MLLRSAGQQRYSKVPRTYGVVGSGSGEQPQAALHVRHQPTHASYRIKDRAQLQDAVIVHAGAAARPKDASPVFLAPKLTPWPDEQHTTSKAVDETSVVEG